MSDNKENIEKTAEQGNQVDAIVMPRFRIEERSGIVAVYDTHHPNYKDTPGCHGDYEWVVASWHGIYDHKAGHWNVEPWKIAKAKLLVELLEKLSA